MKYAEEIIKRLTTAKAPLSPFDIKTETKFPYSGIRETIKQLCIEGYVVQIKSTEKSKKGGPLTLYNVTFKGVLSYLARFNVFPDSSDSTEKEINEKFDKEHKPGLITVLERQGNILNYVPFQESRWLSERDPNLIRSYVTEARFLLRQPLSGHGRPSELSAYASIANDYSKYVDDPNHEPNIDFNDLLWFRNLENSDLIKRFGRAFLGRACLLNGNTENEKMRQFTQAVLDEKRMEINWLEAVVRLFSKHKENT